MEGVECGMAGVGDGGICSAAMTIVGARPRSILDGFMVGGWIDLWWAMGGAFVGLAMR